MTSIKYILTGTDTGIGKTVVATILVAGFNAFYWKPIQSGLKEITDSESVQKVLQLPAGRIIPERFRLSEPLSPHLSAAIDGVSIQLNDFSVPQADPLIIEGAGGVLVPINDQHLMIDLFRHFNLPLILVAKTGLGTINHTLLTLEALRKRNLSVSSVILNGAENTENQKAIEYYGDIKVAGTIPLLNQPLNPELCIKLFKTRLDTSPL